MRSIAGIYTKKVRALLPFVRNDERKYLKDLQMNIEDFCEEENIHDFDILEERFGTVQQTVNVYLESLDSDFLVRRLKIAHVAKWIVTIVILLIITAFTLFIIHITNDYMYLLEHTAAYEEEIIY